MDALPHFSCPKICAGVSSLSFFFFCEIPHNLCDRENAVASATSKYQDMVDLFLFSLFPFFPLTSVTVEESERGREKRQRPGTSSTDWLQCSWNRMPVKDDEDVARYFLFSYLWPGRDALAWASSSQRKRKRKASFSPRPASHIVSVRTCGRKES